MSERATEQATESPGGRKDFRDVAAALREVVRGQVLLPRDEGYEEARRVYNYDIDRQPGLILCCLDVADVLAGVRAARDRDYSVGVRGAGHNVAGLGTTEGELLIDLSKMRGVRVDPERGRARVDGGAQIGDLDHATHAFGQAVPAGIISTTGVGGLTLGGGFGHLSRQYGLTSDNLCSADVVTADGEFVMCDSERHPDLLWALQGGGGNFGVVTSFEFEMHPAGTIYGGPMFWPLEQAREVFYRYREFIEHAPLEMGAFISFHIIPPVAPFPADYYGETMCGVVFCYNGPEPSARTYFERFRSGLPPAIDLTGPMPYVKLQRMFDGLLPRGLYHYWRNVYLRELSDEAIDVHLEYGPRVANIHTTMHMYPLNGAVHRVAPDETAFSYRDLRFAANIVGVAPTPEELRPIREWVREYWDAMHPHSAGTGYVNFLMGDEGRDIVRATYGENYERLVGVKDHYDPENMFRNNHNVPPSGWRA